VNWPEYLQALEQDYKLLWALLRQSLDSFTYQEFWLCDAFHAADTDGEDEVAEQMPDD